MKKECSVRREYYEKWRIQKWGNRILQRLEGTGFRVSVFKVRFLLRRSVVECRKRMGFL